MWTTLVPPGNSTEPISWRQLLCLQTRAADMKLLINIAPQ